MTYSYGGSITETWFCRAARWRRVLSRRPLARWGRPTIVIIMLVVTLIAQLALSFTTHGRRMYAIGGNPEAARLSGLRITRYKVAAYVIASLLAGLGGILLASRIGSSQVNAGGGYLMDGGRGRIGFRWRAPVNRTPRDAGGGGDPRRALQRAGDALGAVLRDGHY